MNKSAILSLQFTHFVCYKMSRIRIFLWIIIYSNVELLKQHEHNHFQIKWLRKKMVPNKYFVSEQFSDPNKPSPTNI